ncbi:unnamed protein product [Cunninghamella blakesleeana]
MMVNDQSIKDWISWSDSGESFLVYDINGFSQEVLPKYFKHSKWSSFIRQLNTYGFCKVADYKNSNDKQTSEFKHPLFNRNGQQVLHKIRRNMKQNIPESSTSSFSSSLPLPLSFPPSPSSTASSALLSSQYGKLRKSSIRSIDSTISVPIKDSNKNKEDNLISIKSLTNINDDLNNLTDDEDMDGVIVTEPSGKYTTISQKINNLQMDAEKLQTEITSLKHNVYNQQEIIEKILSSVMDNVDNDNDLTRETANEKVNELLQSIKNFEKFGEQLILPNLQLQERKHIINTVYDYTTILKPILNHKEISDLKSNNNHDTKNSDFDVDQAVSTSTNSTKLNN